MSEFVKNSPVQPELEQRHRRSIRLRDYDYSQAGAYFVTFCTHKRECLFREIKDGQMVLNELGKIVKEEWEGSGKIRQEIKLDAFVVMPNHIHGILVIHDRRSIGATGRSPLHPYHRTLPPKSLSSFVAGLKSVVTKRINQFRETPGVPVWQRNYYEHIIRNEIDLDESDSTSKTTLENGRRMRTILTT